MESRPHSLLVCPYHHSSRLEFQESVRDRLVCPACSRVFPVEDSIFRVLPDQFLSSQPRNDQSGELEIKISEMAKRDEQAGVYEKFCHPSATKAEVRRLLHYLQPGPKDLILEIGAGTGRTTKSYADQAGSVVALDFSFNSLRILKNNIPHPHLLLLQADACQLPLPDQVFDKVISVSVLQHLPRGGSELQFIAQAARALKKGGLLILTVYRYSQVFHGLKNLLTGLAVMQEGRHTDNRIFYHRYTRSELSRLLRTRLRVLRIEPLISGWTDESESTLWKLLPRNMKRLWQADHFLAVCRKP